MSSEASLASESITLRFLGLSSIGAEGSRLLAHTIPRTAIVTIKATAPTKSTVELTTGMP